MNVNEMLESADRVIGSLTDAFVKSFENDEMYDSQEAQRYVGIGPFGVNMGDARVIAILDEIRRRHPDW